MSRLKSLSIAAATFTAAMGIGFAMQNQELLADRFGPERHEASPAAPALPGLAAIDSIPVGPTLDGPIVEMSAQFIAPSDIGPSRPPIVAPPLLVADLSGDFLPGVADLAVAADCTAAMVATASAGAIAVLDIFVPCQPNAFGTLHHNGMMFTFATDDEGRAALAVPALAETAIFMAQFADDSVAASQLSMPEVADFDRAVLQFAGGSGFELHASEFGAPLGAEGHVWRGALGDTLATVAGDGGFMLILGDETADQSLVAQVYTYPADMGQKTGEIALSVEAAITGANCGRDLAAQSMQFIGGAEPMALDLTLTIPACDGIGDILIVERMFDFWQVAAR